MTWLPLGLSPEATTPKAIGLFAHGVTFGVWIGRTGEDSFLLSQKELLMVDG